MSFSLPVIPGPRTVCAGSPDLGYARRSNRHSVNCVVVRDVKRIDSRGCARYRVDGNAPGVKDHACGLGDYPTRGTGKVAAERRLPYGWLRVRRRSPNATRSEEHTSELQSR